MTPSRWLVCDANNNIHSVRSSAGIPLPGPLCLPCSPSLTSDLACSPRTPCLSPSLSVSLPPPHPRSLRHGGPVAVIVPYPGGFSGCSQFQSPAGLPPCLERRLPSRDTCLPETPESLGTAWGGAPPREVEAPPSSLPCWGGLRGLRGPSRRGEGAFVTPSDLQDSLGSPAPHAWTAAPNTPSGARTHTRTRPAPPCHSGVHRRV